MFGLEPVVQAYLTWVIRQRGRLDLEAITAIWPLAVGRTFAAHTHLKAIAGPRIDVEVPDSVWLGELRFQASTILGRLNRLLPASATPFETLRLAVGSMARPALPARAEAGGTSPKPLSAEQGQALAGIPDEQLRALVARVVGRSEWGDGNPGRSGQSGGKA